MQCRMLRFMIEWESWIRIILIGTSVRDLVTGLSHLFKPMVDARIAGTICLYVLIKQVMSL